MKPDAQRIAIAEACGAEWSKDQHGNDVLKGSGVWVYDFRSDPKWNSFLITDCPEYLESLDAMHKVEKVLTEGQRAEYLKTLLQRGMGGAYGTGPSVYDWWDTTHATATQRAEAFLRTLGKWEEQP